MSSELHKQLVKAGFTGTLASLVGRRFYFTSRGYEIIGTITGAKTCDDGLPIIEVSNKDFAGFEIKDIIIWKFGNKGKTSLITTTIDLHYRTYEGILELL